MKNTLVWVVYLSVTLGLAGCGVAKRAEIRKGGEVDAAAASDRSLCLIAEADGSKTPAHVRAEMERRKLGDCSDEYKRCKSMGFEPNTPQMANCRLELAKAEAAENAARASRPTIVTAPTPPAAPTSCTTIGFGNYARGCPG